MAVFGTFLFFRINYRKFPSFSFFSLDCYEFVNHLILPRWQFSVCFRFQAIKIRWSNQIAGAPFQILFKGANCPSITKFTSTPPKNDIISGCRPLCRQIFDDLSIFLKLCILFLYSLLLIPWRVTLPPSPLTQDQMAPLSAGENRFRTWAVAIIKPNQKLPHVTH